MRKVHQLITKMNTNRELIDELYGKRDRDVLLSSILSDDTDMNTIEVLSRFGIVEYSESHLTLQEPLITFLDNTINTTRDIKIAMIAEDVQYLLEQISDYNDIQIKEKTKALKAIRRYLKRINNTLHIGFKTIQDRVILEYESQNNQYEKLKELNRYKEKVEELVKAEKQVDYTLRSESKVLLNIPNIDIINEVDRLSSTLRMLRSSLSELQGKVLEYIHKIEDKGDYVKTIFTLRELIRNQEFIHKTNILDLIQEEKFERVQHSKEKAISTLLDVEMVEYEPDFDTVVKEVLDGRSLELVPKEARISEPITDEILNESVEISDSVDLQKLYQGFSGQSLDLFSYINNKNFLKPLTHDEKISAYAQVLSLNENKLNITNQVARFENHEIAIIQMKKEQ